MNEISTLNTWLVCSIWGSSQCLLCMVLYVSPIMLVLLSSTPVSALPLSLHLSPLIADGVLYLIHYTLFLSFIFMSFTYSFGL